MTLARLVFVFTDFKKGRDGTFSVSEILCVCVCVCV